MKKSIFFKYLFFIFCIHLIAYNNAFSEVTFGSPEDSAPKPVIAASTTTTTVPECPPGEHRVEGECCPLSMNYLDSVSGICSLCPTGQHIVVSDSNSKCCNPGFSYLVSGECSECEATKTLSNGVCCSSGSLGSNGICCPAGKVNTNGICCDPTQINIKGACACPTGKVTKNGICCKSTEINSLGICCPSGKVNVDNICCSSGQINSENHCCDKGKAWASASSKCCAAIDDKGKCCEGSTPELSSGICCSTGKKRAGTSNTCCDPVKIAGDTCCSSAQDSCGGVCQTPCRKDQIRDISCNCVCANGKTEVKGVCCDNTKVIGTGASAVCCSSSQHVSNGICCSTGKERFGTTNTCCDPLKVIGNICCSDEQYVEGTVCKEKCTLSKFSQTTKDSGSGDGKFGYNTVSGERSSCLEQMAIDAYDFVSDLEWRPGIYFRDNLDSFEDKGGGDYLVDDTTSNAYIGDLMTYAMWLKLAYGSDLNCPDSTDYIKCFEDLNQALTYDDYVEKKSYIKCNGGWTNSNKHGAGSTGFGGGAAIAKIGKEPGTGIFWQGNGVNIACGAGQFVVDSNCNLVKTADIDDECGKTIAGEVKITKNSATPISLVLDENYDINKHISFVEFDLSPELNKNYWTWKGSAKTPLLVYDPEHQGKINSAEQLFGNWTFGGKKLASLINSDASSQLPKPWKNGFEALRTLDANSDGKISGDELSQLALWFDDNQNAISEEGEVRSIDSIGLKALFYNSATEDLVNKTVEVALGFEREEAGEISTGRLVDWSSEGTDTQFELFAKQLLANNNEPKAITNSNSPESVTAKHVPFLDIKVSGLWFWSLNEKPENYVRNGMFFLSSNRKEIVGSTISQLPITINTKDKKGAERKIVQFSALKGVQKENADKSIKINFETNTGSGVIKNTAVISVDGKSMNGQSVAVYQDDSGEKTIKYSWKAKKADRVVAKK